MQIWLCHFQFLNLLIASFPHQSTFLSFTALSDQAPINPSNFSSGHCTVPNTLNYMPFFLPRSQVLWELLHMFIPLQLGLFLKIFRWVLTTWDFTLGTNSNTLFLHKLWLHYKQIHILPQDCITGTLWWSLSLLSTNPDLHAFWPGPCILI